jgi:hypothetical protein
MHRIQFVLAATLGLLATVAVASAPVVLHVADLPQAALTSPASTLAQLRSQTTSGLADDDRPTPTLVSLESGYAEDYAPEGVLQSLPEGWQLSWKPSGPLQSGFTATLIRDGKTVSVDFERREATNTTYRLMGGSPATLYGVIDLNSRYMAVHGSGDWSFRFVDKQTGDVLSYAVADNPNHLSNFLVDRQGAVYIEIVPTEVCLEWSSESRCLRSSVTTARSPYVDRQADGLRKLAFLAAPLTSAQSADWDKALLEQHPAPAAAPVEATQRAADEQPTLLLTLPFKHRAVQR